MTIFRNAKIVGSGIDPAAYIRQESDTIKRGDVGYVMSRSELRAFTECPRRWLAGQKDDRDTTATRWGSLIDCLVLEPEKFPDRYAIQPDHYDAEIMECPSCKSQTDSASCRKCKCDRVKITIQKEWNNNSETCAEWCRKQNGKTVISATEKENAFLAVSQIRNDEFISELIDCSLKQVMIVAEYVDAATGLIVPVKGLIDVVPNRNNKTFGRMIGDLKTARDGNPAKWNRTVYDNGYDWQAAFFLDLYSAASDEQRIDFAHIVQENFAPFEVVSPLPILSSEFLEQGRMKYLSALQKYCQCIASNDWPSFAPTKTSFGGFQIIEPEPWMVSLENAWQTLPRIEPLTTDLEEITP